jgi:cupin superfamily acireductone dioxygenase involved in methionine salvage
MAIQEVRNSQQIILESLEALKEAQANKKDSLKERIRKISDYRANFKMLSNTYEYTRIYA